MSNKLKEISEEIRNIIIEEQKNRGLKFIEESHKYFIKNKDGELVSDLPSVSKVIKQFYEPFDTVGISERISGGDIELQYQKIMEWRNAGKDGMNIGSIVHYFLEKDITRIFDINKDVRKPIFEIKPEIKSVVNNMVKAGNSFINTMIRRGCYLIDTEIVLGSYELGYVGQPDKIWIIEHNGKIGFIVTDWKTNKEKAFKPNAYTKKMFPPFDFLDDTSLSKYKLQLSFYGRLFIDMLKNSKYKNLPFLGGIIVNLKRNGDFNEYMIEKKIIKKVMKIDPLENINMVYEQERNEKRIIKEIENKLNGKN
jgi:hypothetical protein